MDFDDPFSTGRSWIDAPPPETFPVVSDPVLMASLADELDTVEWLGGAARAEVGAEFLGHNRNGRRRWTTTCRVTDLDPDRRFAYDVRLHVAKPISRSIPISRWQYDIEPAHDGSTVTVRSWVRMPLWSIPVALAWSGIVNRPGANNAHIETQLGRLKEHLEAAPPTR